MLQTPTPKEAAEGIDLAFKVLTTLGAIIAAISGAIGFFLTRYWNRRDQRQEREWRLREQEAQAREVQRAAQEAARSRFREVLFESLRWFEGKTQKRSIGTSIVEASWKDYPEFHQIWRGVLVNQAVYLLTGSEQGDSATEIANLRRIMTLLVREASALDPVSRASLRSTLEHRLRETPDRGLAIEHSELARWWQDAGFNAA
jgi:hypothetical protein